MPQQMTPEKFNELYPVGTPVVVYPGARPEVFPSGRRIETKTSTKAWSAHGTPVVMVEDHSTWVSLSHVDAAVAAG